MNTLQENAENLWRTLVNRYRSMTQASMDFQAAREERVEVLRKELYGRDRDVALHYARLLKSEDLQKLFGGLIHIARSAHGPFNAAWDLIKSMPRDWVLANIEQEADAILANEEEDDYWMFLNFYQQLDTGLANRLAVRASQHNNPAIQELGRDVLEKLSQKNGCHSSP